MIVKIRVSANSAQQSVEEKDGFLKVRVKAKPTRGKANKEVIGALAKHFKTNEENIFIKSGFSSSKKTVLVT